MGKATGSKSVSKEVKATPKQVVSSTAKSRDGAVTTTKTVKTTTTTVVTKTTKNAPAAGSGKGATSTGGDRKTALNKPATGRVTKSSSTTAAAPAGRKRAGGGGTSQSANIRSGADECTEISLSCFVVRLFAPCFVAFSSEQPFCQYTLLSLLFCFYMHCFPI